MIVLGLDPSTTSLGYAVLASPGNRVIECGTAKARGKDRTARIVEIGSDVRALLLEHRPDAVVLETPFVQHRNSAIPLGEIRGILLWLAHEAKVPTADYAPAQVRKAIGVGGGADKAAVGKWVTRACGLAKQPEPDATDALAVALAHTLTARP